jgi:hypothetical protein
VGGSMKKIGFFFISIILTSVSLSGVPYTTMGFVRTPDAYVLPHKTADITFNNYLRREDNSYTTNASYEYIPNGMVNVGILDRIEVGAWGGDRIGFANLKVKVIEETNMIPQFAVGIDNLFSPVNENSKTDHDYNKNVDGCFYEKNSPYLVFSKTSVLKGMTGIKLLESTISLGVGRNKFIGQVSIAKRFEGIFGSITIKPQKNVAITMENDGFNLNAGAQYTYKNFAVKVAYVGIEEQENNRIGLGLSYFFDKFADAKRRPNLMMEDENASNKGTENIISPVKGGDINANKDLLDELKKLREQREQTQKVLDDLKNQLKDIEEESQTNN